MKHLPGKYSVVRLPPDCPFTLGQTVDVILSDIFMGEFAVLDNDAPDGEWVIGRELIPWDCLRPLDVHVGDLVSLLGEVLSIKKELAFLRLSDGSPQTMDVAYLRKVLGQEKG